VSSWNSKTAELAELLIGRIDDAEQSLSVEDKVLLAQAASERAAIVLKYDKVSVLVCFNFFYFLS